MIFDPPLVPARLVRRYKRFLADVVLDDGRALTVHCPNPGAMLGVAPPGARIWLKPAKAHAKLPYGWMLAEVDDTLIGIDTNIPNRLVGEALTEGRIPELGALCSLRAEVHYGTGSRIDFLADSPRGPVWIEVKNVHLRRKPNLAEFPDCVTARGAKHLDELAIKARQGERAVMIYVIQRMDCAAFALAQDIDPTYAGNFRRAQRAGVEALAYSCMIARDGIRLDRAVPIIDPA